MAVDLTVLLPEWFQNVMEFNELMKSEETELEEAENSIQSVRNNCYIQTADEKTILLYEKRIGLVSGSIETLEERRKAVLTRLNRKVPYSMGYLKGLLSLWVGEENYIIDTSHFTAYVLGLYIKEQTLSVLHDIKAEVRDIVPAHMVLDFYGRYQGDYNIQVSYENVIRFRTAFYPRYNLPRLYLDNIWPLDGSHRLSGYDRGESIDFYPVRSRFLAKVINPVRMIERLNMQTAVGESVTADDNILRFRTGGKEEAKSAVGMIFQCETTGTATVGPVRVMNKNVMDNNWKLGGERQLNGGLSIL